MSGLEIEEREGGILLPLTVTPRARQSELQGVGSGRLKLRIAAAPADGAANRACLQLVADLLGVRRRAVTLLRGATARHKLVRVEGLSAALAARRLEAHLAQRSDQ